MRVLMTFVAWIGSAAVLAPVCFFAVIILAGPHSSMLPSAVQPLVLIAGWLVFLVAPFLVARKVWRSDSIRAWRRGRARRD